MLDYKFSNDGTLTIYGEGDMKSSASYGRHTGAVMYPWTTGTILTGTNKVVIESGITEIGGYAFRQSRLKEIIIPETVNEIRKQAFFSAQILNRYRFLRG